MDGASGNDKLHFWVAGGSQRGARNALKLPLGTQGVPWRAQGVSGTASGSILGGCWSHLESILGAIWNISGNFGDVFCKEREREREREARRKRQEKILGIDGKWKGNATETGSEREDT